MDKNNPVSSVTEPAADKEKDKRTAKKAKGKDRDAGLTEEEKRLRTEQRKRAAKKKRKKIIKTLIIILIILSIVAFALWKFIDIKRREQAANTLVTYTVDRRTITEKLSATGTLQPVDSYTVISKVRGDIIASSFEEGDEVRKDDILYVIDSDDMDSTIRQRELSVEKAKKTLLDLEEKRNELASVSDMTGIVTKLYVEVGDTVQKGGVIADIVDNEHMLIDVPFHASHADMMGYGTVVTLVIDGSGEMIQGTVTEVDAVTGTNAYGAPTKNVTVMVQNPGGISKETKAVGQCGDSIISTDLASFYYNVEDQLKAEYGGEIRSLAIAEGSRVYDGQTVILFDGDELEDQIKDAKDNLETAQMNYDDTIESMGDYEIKAPITGTVVEKNFNVGESIDITGGNATVAIIYDLSALTFDMSIDELDIFSIEKGQEVEITSDAMSEVFYGEITKISKVGTTISGTTVYPVTVTITDQAALSKLLPGMNIDAEITVNKVENVIAVPTGAVARGNTVKVIKNPDALKEWQASQMTKEGNSYSGDRREQNEATAKTSTAPDAFGNMQSGDNMTAPAEEQSGTVATIPENRQNAGERPFGRGTSPNGQPIAEYVEKGEAPLINKGDAKGEASFPAAENENGSIPAKTSEDEINKAASMTSDGTNAGLPAMEEGMAAVTDGMVEKGGMQNMQRSAIYGSAPADTEYEIVKVETGISDDEYVEIISGLEEGDIVIIEQNQVSSASMFGMMGMGGMPGGMGGMSPAGGNMGASRGGNMAGGNRQGGAMAGGR